MVELISITAAVALIIYGFAALIITSVAIIFLITLLGIVGTILSFHPKHKKGDTNVDKD